VAELSLLALVTVAGDMQPGELHHFSVSGDGFTSGDVVEIMAHADVGPPFSLDRALQVENIRAVERHFGSREVRWDVRNLSSIAILGYKQTLMVMRA
jgi:hypothetical protein